MASEKYLTSTIRRLCGGDDGLVHGYRLRYGCDGHSLGQFSSGWERS